MGSTRTSIKSQSYIFDPRPTYPLRVAVKRYWKGSASPPDAHDPTAVTLVLSHGVGFHKEQWEPFIEDLYSLIESESDKHGRRLKVQDVWALDSPNHGNSAVLNEKELEWGYEHVFLIEEVGRVISLLLSGLGTGVDVDFSKRRLIGVGHSMGASSLILSQTFHPIIPFEALIIIEIITTAKKFVQLPSPRAAGAAVRRDIWESKEDAYETFKKRVPWKVWDERVLRTFVNHGLRDLPTATYPDKTSGVTLKCPRLQEAACYRDYQGMARTYNALTFVPRRVPVHMIQGTRDELISAATQEDFIENAVGGIRKLASFVRIPDSGHLIPQTHPKQLAARIHGILVSTSSPAKL